MVDTLAPVRDGFRVRLAPLAVVICLRLVCLCFCPAYVVRLRQGLASLKCLRCVLPHVCGPLPLHLCLLLCLVCCCLSSLVSPICCVLVLSSRPSLCLVLVIHMLTRSVLTR